MNPFISLSLALLFSFPLWSQIAVPPLNSPVEDLGGFFTPEQRETLSQKIIALKNQTGAQAQILTINSLEGESVEGLSIRVADSWKLGEKGKDNGLLFLMSRQERKIRIEVGSGLEGDITDYQSHQMIQKMMIPAFKKGDFFHGFEKALDYSQALISQDKEAIAKLKPLSRKKSSPFVAFLPFIFTFFVGGLLPSKKKSVSLIRGLLTGGTLVGGTWLLLGVLPLPVFIGIGLFGFLIGFAGFASSSSYSSGGSSSYRHRGGSGGFSGGGWSGGGGGFSGGGASGGW